MQEISKAVSNLRAELGLSQKAFAEDLNVSAKSVLRYEQGVAPSRKVLMALAQLSDEAGKNDLAEIFTTARDRQIAQLVSTGSAPRVPRRELAAWYKATKRMQTITRFGLENAIDRKAPKNQIVIGLAGEIADLTETVLKQMKPYL